MDAPEQLTLKQKWNDHYEKGWQLKPEEADKWGIGVFWVFSTLLMYTSMTLYIPDYSPYRKNDRWWFYGIAIFLYAQCMVNWILIRKTSSIATAKNVPQGNEKLVTSLPAGWRSCLTCQMDVPPRAHHCKLCKACVLKRDHHCFFTGTCIGFYNQRRFLVFNFYTVIANVIGIYLMLMYLRDPLPFRGKNIWSYIIGVNFCQWITGRLPLSSFLIVMQIYVAALIGAAALMFFFWGMSMAIRGQTSFEVGKGIQRYRVGTMKHLRSVFGPYGLLQFVAPLPIAQAGDGVNWLTEKATKGN